MLISLLFPSLTTFDVAPAVTPASIAAVQSMNQQNPVQQIFCTEPEVQVQVHKISEPDLEVRTAEPPTPNSSISKMFLSLQSKIK